MLIPQRVAAQASVLRNFSPEAQTSLYHKVRRHFRRHGRIRLKHPPEAEGKEETKAPDSGNKPPAMSAKEAPKQSEAEKAPPPSKNAASTDKQAEPYGPPPPPEKWSEAEIQAGWADCEKLLRNLKIAYDRLDPLRDGACGLPAPIRLKAIESDKLPAISIDPPAIISCKLAAALDKWVEEVVQPNAKAKLDASVIRLENISGYMCRSRYDDPSQRISQHAYANAIDVSGFVTAKNETVTVLNDWNAGNEKAAFLKGIHDGACEIFGTTLGPEANAAHKNHFHLDMTERRYRKLCDFTPKQIAERKQAALHTEATEPTATKPAAHSASKGDGKQKKADEPPASTRGLRKFAQHDRKAHRRDQ